MPSYSAVEKENALRLCDEIGVAKASEQTGISVKSLYTWRSGAEEKGAAAVAHADVTPFGEAVAEEEDTSENIESKGPGKRYGAEEKEKALRLCDKIGITKVSKQTGIAIGSLRKWRMDAKKRVPAAAVDKIPMVKASEQNVSQTDDECTSADIADRFSKTSVRGSVAEDKTLQPGQQIAAVDAGSSKELIRLQLENAALKLEMLTIKKALRVFTE